jgi:hypothetical protein
MPGDLGHDRQQGDLNQGRAARNATSNVETRYRLRGAKSWAVTRERDPIIYDTVS